MLCILTQFASVFFYKKLKRLKVAMLTNNLKVNIEFRDYLKRLAYFIKCIVCARVFVVKFDDKYRQHSSV